MTMCMLGNDGDDNYDDGKNHENFSIDMEIRDYFAGQILLGMITANPSFNYVNSKEMKLVIKSSYNLADMMMKERDK